ncbi:MAG: hypothetical protein KBS34_05650, partial [Phascolarctobacterium sp.]|nr:hypothetical protein [Candidatus Phascolarctobacterium equi]
MITDSNGIDTTNSELTDKVLNRLANKLFYYNAGNDSNLSGKVAIAEGLTAASAYKMIGDVVYNTTTGQGGYGAAPEDIVYNVSITGDSAVDTGYDADGVLENGKYTFEMPTAIEIANIADAGAVMATKSLTIDTNDLAINLVGHGSSNSYGIKAVGNDAVNTLKVTVDGGETKIIAKDGTKSNIGIYASGNSLVTVNGDLIMHAGEGYAVNTAKSGGDYYGATAIYAANNYGDMQKGGQITVNGQVDLLVDANGVFVNGGGGVVTLAGGSIEINKDNTKHYAALRAESGYINMNMNAEKTAAGTNKVNILGNVDTTAGAYNLASEPCVDSIVNLGMTTSDSTWTGVAYNAFPDAGLGGIATTGTWKGQERKFIGAINLWLQNGAIWNNEQYGAIEKPYTGSAFTGSHVNNFVGGDSSSNAGVIIHKDTNPLTIDNYSGNAKVVMSHSNDGDEVSDYVAGNLIIKSAAEGSVITLVTDKRGIDVDNAGAVENTLGALASKLFYTASTMGENYLTGYVSIAEGLTAKSVSMFTGGIEFNATTGQGVYKDITPPPPVPVDPDPTSVSDKYLMGTMSDSSFLGDKVASVEGAVTYDLTDETYSFRQMSTVADAKVVLNVGTQNTVYFDGMKNGNLAMMVNDGANVTINGNVNTTSYGSSYSAAGIAMIIGGSGAGKETHLTINGRVTMGTDDEHLGIVAEDKHGAFGTYRGSRWTGAGINMNQGHGSTITITDGLSIYADGHGIVTDPYYPDKKYADKDLAVVTVNGPSTIHVGGEEDVGLYALANYGGTININMKDGQ